MADEGGGRPQQHTKFKAGDKAILLVVTLMDLSYRRRRTKYLPVKVLENERRGDAIYYYVEIEGVHGYQAQWEPEVKILTKEEAVALSLMGD